MSAREELLAQARRHVWAAWQLSAEELASQAASTLLGLGMLVPEGGAQELEKLAERVVELEAEREKLVRWHREDGKQLATMRTHITELRENLQAVKAGWDVARAERDRYQSAWHNARTRATDGWADAEAAEARVAELEAQAAQLAPLREAALHDLPPGTQWRVIATDSESLTGLAPVCTADRRFHEIADYPGGPKYDDEGVYDCCPWPQVETYSVAVAAYLVALLNADVEPQPEP